MLTSFLVSLWVLSYSGAIPVSGLSFINFAFSATSNWWKCKIWNIKNIPLPFWNSLQNRPIMMIQYCSYEFFMVWLSTFFFNLCFKYFLSNIDMCGWICMCLYKFVYVLLHCFLDDLTGGQTSQIVFFWFWNLLTLTPHQFCHSEKLERTESLKG